MNDESEWITYRDQVCYPIEKYLLGYSVRDKERLISAIISNAFLNEKVDFEQLKKIHMDKSLETIGDFVLDYAILDNFPKKNTHPPRKSTICEHFTATIQLSIGFQKIVSVYRILFSGGQMKERERLGISR